MHKKMKLKQIPSKLFSSAVDYPSRLTPDSVTSLPDTPPSFPFPFPMGSQSTGHFNYPGFDCLPDFQKDYYKVLEVDYYAKEEMIRLNYLRLALKWHPDKHNGEEFAKAKFQEINEAYQVLSDPAKRLDYDMKVDPSLDQYNAMEYLDRFQGLILTCNGLGMNGLGIHRW